MNEWIIIVIIINANIITVILNVWLTALFCLWSALAMADKAPTANSVQFVIMNLAIANCISFRKDSRPHGVWESQQFQNTSYTNDVFVVGDNHLQTLKIPIKWSIVSGLNTARRFYWFEMWWEQSGR